MRTRNIVDSLGGFAFGAAVGYVIGVLSAPKSGKQLRSDIKSTSCNVCQCVKDSAEKSKEELAHRAAAVESNVANNLQEMKKTLLSMVERLDANLHRLVSVQTVRNTSSTNVEPPCGEFSSQKTVIEISP